MAKGGKLITVEGVDGAGKSTHLAFLADCIRGRGHRVLTTREPGGTPLAEALRELLMKEPMDGVAEALLMFAARADHVARVIEPALAGGNWVLCDRFTDATLAYQGAGKGVQEAFLVALAKQAHPALRPDLTLLFDCPYDISRQRLERTGKVLDRFEREDQAFFERVRDRYLKLAKEEPARWRVIDASKGLAEIKKSVKEAVSSV
ncbi:MAG TPA: dTMP kinase [Burkholderiales bacterium]